MDWNVVIRDLLHLGAAHLIALPAAHDREEASQGTSLRTYPLVAVAACGYTFVGFSMLDSTDAEARVLQGLITGIGFIGGGAILKRGGSYDERAGTWYIQAPAEVAESAGFR